MKKQDYINFIRVIWVGTASWCDTFVYKTEAEIDAKLNSMTLKELKEEYKTQCM